MSVWPFRKRVSPKGLFVSERVDRLPIERVRNEIAQLISIRDDAQRVAPGSLFHSWLNGAIFALEWSATPYDAEPPSAAAGRQRLGIGT